MTTWKRNRLYAASIDVCALSGLCQHTSPPEGRGPLRSWEHGRGGGDRGGSVQRKVGEGALGEELTEGMGRKQLNAANMHTRGLQPCHSAHGLITCIKDQQPPN